MAVWAELMRLIDAPVCILACVFLSLWDVCSPLGDDITMLLHAALGKIFNYLNSVGGVFVVCHCCGLHIILATHAILQLTKRELTDFGSVHTPVQLSAVAPLIYSCCSSWALSILMWQIWPHRCLAVNDTMNNLFVNIVYMDTVDVDAFQK